MKVAVVWNNDTSQVINRFGQPCPEKYGRMAVERVVQGLRDAGHEVEMIQADVRMIDALDRFLPRAGRREMPDGMVFNMAYGVQGECRYTHVPAMLELAGIPYTGSSPMGHTLALDKVVTKILIREAGVPTPNWVVAQSTDVRDDGLRYPLIVKPRHESTSFGLRVVHNRDELRAAVEVILTQFSQDALVEEFITGREVCVGLLGNDPPECLPLVELDFAGRDLSAFTWEDKTHKRPDEPTRLCPAPVPNDLADQMRAMAVATFKACHCRDYSRVDIRIDRDGNPFVLEINSMASLGGTASFVLAATASGHTFSSLVNRIVEVAHHRHLIIPVPEPTPAPESPADASEPAAQPILAP